MITLSTAKILEAHQGLLLFCEKDYKLPVQAAWDLDSNLDAMENIVKRFEKHRDRILSPLREKNALIQKEDGTVYCTKEFEKEFVDAVNEINSLLEIENEIDIVMIPRSSLPSELTMKDLRSLKFMIDAEA